MIGSQGAPPGMVTIGLLVPQEGPAGIWAPSAEASAALAVHELNQMGGLLGREVRLSVIDAGATARSAAEAASIAVEIDRVDAVVAMVPSFARAAIAGAVARRVPYVYTPQFEGFEPDGSVVMVGETSDELLLQGIRHLTETRRARRFFLIGNDYIWPRMSFATARGIIGDEGGIVVGEMLLPFGFADHDRVFEAIRRSGADVVIPYFLGAESISFNRAFAELGLAGKILRFASAIDETILYGIGENATENLYVPAAYFSAVRSANNGGFLERYHGLFGDSPPPANALGQSCYEGVHCLASLVGAAGALRVPDVRRQLGRVLQGRTARGTDPRPIAGSRRPIHLAMAEGCDLRLIDPR
jgi:urea transport system substrate-binding protein